MAVRIANLKILVSANTRGLVGAFGKASRVAKKFGGGIVSLGGKLLSGITSLKGLAVGLIGIVGVAATARLAISSLREQFDQLDKLGKTSAKLGATAESLQKIRFAAQLTGSEIDATDNAMVKFTKAVAEAAEGVGEAITSFEAMKISAEDLIGLDLDEQLLEISDGFRRLGREEKLLAVSRLFGRSGTTFVNTLNQSREALEAVFKERGELGLFTDEQIKQIESANDTMTKFGIQINFVKGSIAATLSPFLDELIDGFVEAGKEGEFNFNIVGDAIRGVTINIAKAIDLTSALIQKFQLLQIGARAGKLVGTALAPLGRQLNIEANLATAEFGTPALDAVLKFFDRVDERIRRSREEARKSFDLGGDLPGPAGQIAAVLPAALERGSAAAFSFLAKSGLEGQDLARAAVRNGELQITALDRIIVLTQQLVKKQGGVLQGAQL